MIRAINSSSSCAICNNGCNQINAGQRAPRGPEQATHKVATKTAPVRYSALAISTNLNITPDGFLVASSEKARRGQRRESNIGQKLSKQLAKVTPRVVWSCWSRSGDRLRWSARKTQAEARLEARSMLSSLKSRHSRLSPLLADNNVEQEERCCAAGRQECRLGTELLLLPFLIIGQTRSGHDMEMLAGGLRSGNFTRMADSWPIMQ